MANLGGGAFFPSNPASGSSTARAGHTGANLAATRFVITLFKMLQLVRGIRIGVALPVPLRTAEPAG